MMSSDGVNIMMLFVAIIIGVVVYMKCFSPPKKEGASKEMKNIF